VKCIFALILVLIMFKHPKYRIRKIVLICVLGMVGGRGGNGATAPGIQGRGASKE